MNKKSLLLETLIFSEGVVLMELNVNQTVNVKLTDFGKTILESHHYEMQNMLKKYNPNHKEWPFELKLTKDGYYRDQLWHIMSIFGNYMDIGRPQPFLASIIVED